MCATGFAGTASGTIGNSGGTDVAATHRSHLSTVRKLNRLYRPTAISFLLLLAVADDAIGLGIIAVAYPDPLHPTVWGNLLWIVPGMATAFVLRKLKVQSWLPYVIIGGAFCWWGLHSAHLHPALALVFIVPFLPGPGIDLGLYTETQQDAEGKFQHKKHSPLENFEHDLRSFVDCGLFFFALANAGVSFSGVGSLTWIVVAALVVGKLLGITLFSSGAKLVGFPLPEGMNFRHLVVTGVIAGLGLTVALFVSGQAFAEAATQDAAKMGALFSAGVGGLAFVLAWSLGIVQPDLGSIRRTWETAVRRPASPGIRAIVTGLPATSQPWGENASHK